MEITINNGGAALKQAFSTPPGAAEEATTRSPKIGSSMKSTSSEGGAATTTPSTPKPKKEQLRSGSPHPKTPIGAKNPKSRRVGSPILSYLSRSSRGAGRMPPSPAGKQVFRPGIIRENITSTTSPKTSSGGRNDSKPAECHSKPLNKPSLPENQPENKNKT